MPDVAEPITHCLKCGGPVWDNRADKPNPKSPDFKCRDRDNCGEGYWLAKGKGGAIAARPPRAQPVSRPVVEQQYDVIKTVEVPHSTPMAGGKVYDYESIQTNMAECFKFAVDLFDEVKVDRDPRALAQICDTLFIERQRRGV